MKSSQSSTNKKLETALEYSRMGISVIPWGPTKNSPLLKSWTEYQTRRASEEEIRTWWKKWPEANPFGVMGAVSGIVMFDIDKQYNRSASEFDIPLTASTRTPQGGNHFFFKHPGFTVKARDGLFGEGVDFKGDGGLAGLPGTTYRNGGSYKWLITIEDELADIPQWLLDALPKINSVKKWENGIDGVTKGERNSTAASLAGKILSGCPEELQDSIGWTIFKNWNGNNTILN